MIDPAYDNQHVNNWATYEAEVGVDNTTREGFRAWMEKR